MKAEKKEALTQFHRQMVQKSAETLFLKKGVEATSIDEIAKNAGYSKATLYVYFKSKMDIWHNVLLSSMKMLKENVAKAALTGGNSIAKYFSVCDAIVDFSEKYPLYFDSLLGTIVTDGEEINRQIYEVGEEVMNIVGKLLVQGIEEGVVRQDVKFPDIAIVLWASISGVIKMANQKEDYFSTTAGCSKRELLKYGFEILLRGIMV